MPSRKLPFTDSLSTIFNDANGFTALFLFLLSAFIIQGLLPYLDLKAFFFLRGELETTTGIISDVAVIDVMDDNGQFNAYTYNFDSPLGPLQWVSYGEGGLIKYNIGKRVKIEYHPENPQISRIVGLTNTPGGKTYISFLLGPLISGLYLLYCLIVGFRKYQLLSKGIIGKGKLKDKIGLRGTVEDRPVYKMTFEFKARDGMSYTVKAKSHQPEKLEDEEEELLIYWPSNPKRAVLVDDLPYNLPDYIRYNCL